jgi:hypothetical protein
MSRHLQDSHFTLRNPDFNLEIGASSMFNAGADFHFRKIAADENPSYLHEDIIWA